jgi:CRP/FNR family transcriptional regulator, cyclic AMP receptor protein
MSIRTVEQLVGAAQLFSGLAPQHLETIAGCASTARFAEDEHLFREGGSADTFYVIRSGSVALETHVPGRRPARVLTLHEDDVLGWSWLFPPYRWQFDAQALEPVRAVAFDGTCLRTKCTNDHTLGYELMRRFAQVMVSRLQATRLQLLDVYGDDG